MLPGMSELMPKGKEREGQARIKRFMVIMDSMTNEELDNPKLQFTPDRQMRTWKEIEEAAEKNPCRRRKKCMQIAETL